MVRNLLVAYDLYNATDSKTRVEATIQALGDVVRMQPGLWYVRAPLTASEAVSKVWMVMDANDALVVVDASANEAAWRNIGSKTAMHVKELWSR